MKTQNKHLSHNPAYLVYALIVASLILSGCGRSEASTKARHTDKGVDLEVGTGNTAHTHDNPDGTCFICDPSKRDKGRLWCKEHGRFENRCWLCHPELEEKDRLFCKEHALYEDECFLCHPELKSDGEAALDAPSRPNDGADGAAVLQCNEHGVPVGDRIDIVCGDRIAVV